MESHLKVAEHIAGANFRRMGGEYDVIHSAALLGLVQAARSYRPDGGASFKSHASNRIQGAILDDRRAVHGRRTATGGYRPATVDTVPLDLEDVPDDANERLTDISALPEDLALSEEMRENIELALWRLPERERLLVEGVYLQGRPIAPIAIELGLGESRAGQLLRRALVRLRLALVAQGYEP